MCKFCESLESWKNIHEFHNQDITKDEKVKCEYTVALLIHSWCPKYKTKRQASRLTDYRNKGSWLQAELLP